MLLVSLLWLLFAGTHIGLAHVREPLSKALGPQVFFWGFNLVAALTFSLLAVGYSLVKDSGPPGLSLAHSEWARPLLIGVAWAGIVLMAGALSPAGYWESPISVAVSGVREAVGLERITRHPFFSGTVLTMGAHALLATRATGTIFFSGFVFLAVFGAMHQSPKLHARHGPDLARYYATTSSIPFLAILRKKQHLVLGELPWVAFAVGAAAGYGLRSVHASIFAWHGAPVAVAIGGGGLLLAVIMTVLAKKRQSSEPTRSKFPSGST